MILDKVVQCRQFLVVNFLCVFEIKLFCFVVAILDLVDDVAAIFHIS